MKKFLVLLCCLPLLAFAQSVTFQFKGVTVAELSESVIKGVLHQDFVISADVVASSAKLSMSVKSVPREKVLPLLQEVLKGSGFAVSLVDNVIFIDLLNKDKAAVDISKVAAASVPSVSEVEKEFIVYRPVHRSASYLQEVVSGVLGAHVFSSAMKDEKSGQVSKGSGEPDLVVLSVRPVDVGKVKRLLSELDTSAGEVLLKAAVFEVSKEQKEGGALQVLGSLLSGRLGVQVGQVLKDSNSLSLKVGGLEAVLSALDTDSRFKSISRPYVRVRNGSKASFTVGSDVPVLAQAQVDKSGNAVQSVEYRSSGVLFSAVPQIRQAVIEVDVQQELSNFVQTATGVNGSPTLNKRSVTTKLLMQSGEVVVFGGLQSDEEAGDSSRLPFLGWLLGRSASSKSSEIVVLLEALRI